MPKKSKKSKSKRLTLHQKYKILRKVREHNRKKAKDAKKRGGRAKAPKDPGIPNAWPFKEQLVKELEFEREQAEAAKAARREAARERRAVRRAGGMDEEDDEMADGDDGHALGDMAAQAASRAHDFDAAATDRAQRTAAAGAPEGTDLDRSRRAFYKEFVKVVDAADVIIQVLDARDPLACRAPEVERFVRSRGPDKRLVLLLNKVDLVPRHAAEAWLAYFREELPCVAFKCATSAGGASAGRGKAATTTTPGGGGGASSAGGGAGGGECLGADMLIGLLKNYARSRGGLKTAVRVGVVGLPNVGKSSLINSLCRSRAVAAGAQPGVTRAAQEVKLDKHVTLLDSPGIVFATSAGGDDAAAALRNAIAIERLEDPVAPVEEILKRASGAKLQALYAIPRFDGVQDFLRHVARSRGKLKRGGVADTVAAAKCVLQDWNSGRIPFFTLPPSRGNEEHAAATVVPHFSADFDVAAINSAVIQEAAPGAAAGGEEDFFVQMPSAAPGAVRAVLDDGAMDAMDDATATAAVAAAGPADDDFEAAAAARKADKRRDSRAQNAALYAEDGMFNPKAARQQRKLAHKAAAVAEAAGGRQQGAGLSRAGKPRDEDEDDDEFDWEAATADARAEAARRALGADAEDSDDDGGEDEEDDMDE